MKLLPIYLLTLLLFGCGAGNNNQPQITAIPSLTTYKYVVVGDNNIIIASQDGITWEKSSYSNEESNSLKSITHNKQFFISVGDKGTILYSVDGLNWKNTSKINHNVIDFNQVIPIENKPNSFMAVGNGGYAEIKCTYLGTVAYNCVSISIKFLLENDTDLISAVSDDMNNIISTGTNHFAQLLSKFSLNNYIWSLNTTLGVNNYPYSVFYDESQYLIVASKDNILSNNYEFESSVKYANQYSIKQVLKFESEYIAITNNTYMANSKNLLNWSTDNNFILPFVPNYFTTDCSEILLVGNNGSIGLINKDHQLSVFKFNNIIFNSATIKSDGT